MKNKNEIFSRKYFLKRKTTVNPMRKKNPNDKKIIFFNSKCNVNVSKKKLI